jgi:Xaa-Pro aminopeptidase
MIRYDDAELLAARRRRVAAACMELEIDCWLLTTSHAVRFVTGAVSSLVDLVGENRCPIVAVGENVHEGLPPPNCPAFVDAITDLLPRGGRVAIDRWTPDVAAALRKRLADVEFVDAEIMLGRARGPKERCEIDVMQAGLHRCEKALLDVLHRLEPGTTERELNGAYHLAAITHDLDELHVDTVFAVQPARAELAPWTRGEWADRLPYREITSSRRLEAGDHVAFDAGGVYGGYAADCGWTLRVGRGEPNAVERALADKWREIAARVIEVVRAGRTAGDLKRAALRGWPAGEPCPWPHGLYVAHGIGTRPAEPPFVGAALPAEIEEAMVLQSGDVLMIEPLVWQDGVGSFRAEYCVAVEADGARMLNALDVGYWAHDLGL